MVQNIPFRTITSPNKTEDVIPRYIYPPKRETTTLSMLEWLRGVKRRNKLALEAVINTGNQGGP